ncbi:MAG: hypothetical protein WAR79_11840 [Melioribacteraceae bacterium]
MYTINQISSFAFKYNCSYIGGKPHNNVLNGLLGQLVFFFNPEHNNNFFFQWLRLNHNSTEYFQTTLNYKGKSYAVIFLSIPQKIEKKFLKSFKQFSKKQTHFINYF